MGQITGFTIVAIVILFTYSLFNLLRTRATRLEKVNSNGCSPPPEYPHKDPILGLDLFFENLKNFREHRFLDGLKQRFDENGQTFKTLSMGRTAIWTNDPKNLQTIHALRFKDWGVQPLRQAPTLPFLGEGVFTMDGPFWQHSRDLIRPTFTRANIANFQAFEVHFQKFLDLIPRDGSTVDLRPLLNKLVEFLFGESIGSLAPNACPDGQHFLDTFHNAQRGMGQRIQLGRLMFLHRSRKWRDAIATAHAFADRYVDKALKYRSQWLLSKGEGRIELYPSEEDAGSGARHVLLEEMVKEDDDRVELRSQILHIFLAGHDSTAITVSNAIFHLCRNQDQWIKLRSAVLAVGDVPLTFELLKDIHHLQYIVKEALRLHPVAPTDARIAYHDTILPTGGGLTGTSPILVEKGQIVASSFHALHHRSQAWGPDASVFRPERWQTARPGWDYLPFGGGPRMCPGHQLALTEAGYVLARMAQVWESCECRDPVSEWVEEMEMTCKSRNGVKVGVGWSVQNV